MYSPEELADKRYQYLLDNRRLQFMQRIELDLSVARDKVLFDVAGDVINMESIDGECDIYFNDAETDFAELDKTRKIYMDFYKFRITNAAQAGKTAVILVGRQGTFDGHSDVARETTLELMATADKQDTMQTAIDLISTKDNQGKGFFLSASDNEQIADNTERATAGTGEVKQYQFTMLSTGIVRITFRLKEFVVGRSAWALVKVNGVQIGATHTENGQVYQDKTQDLAVGEGDLLQLWTRDSAADGQAWTRDVKVKCDQALDTPAVGEVSI